MIDRVECIYVGVDLHKETHIAVFIDAWEDKIGKAIILKNNPFI